MAIQEERTFGQLRSPAASPARGSNNNQRDPNWVASEYWMNIGYQTRKGVPDRITGEIVDHDRFVSIGGLAMDSFKPRSTSNESDVKNLFNGLENKLYEQAMAALRQLKPGQNVVLPGKIMGIWQIQLRRRNEDKAEALANVQSAPGEDFVFDINSLMQAAE